MFLSNAVISKTRAELADRNWLELIHEELLSGTISWQQLTPAEYHEKEEQGIVSLFAAETALPWEKEYLRKDGTLLPSLVGGTLIDQERGLAFLSMDAGPIKYKV